MKETNYVLCKCSEDVFEEIVRSEPVYGTHNEFMMHQADFYSLSDETQAEVALEYLYKK